MILINKKRESGSALIFLMVLASMSALAIVSIQNYLIKSQKNIGKTSHKIEYKSILKSIKNVVEGQGFCNKPTTGLVMGSGNSNPAKLNGTNITSIVAPKNLRFSHNGASINLSKNWKNAQGNIKVTNIRLKYIDGWRAGDPHTFATTARTSLPGRYYLIIDALICEDSDCVDGEGQFVTNERRASDNELSPYGIDIILEMRFEANRLGSGAVALKSGGRAVTCFGSATGAARCEEMGRIWNPFNPVAANRCEPHGRCLERRLIGSVCPTPYQKLLTGYTTGKTPRYICFWCNSYAESHKVTSVAP